MSGTWYRFISNWNLNRYQIPIEVSNSGLSSKIIRADGNGEHRPGGGAGLAPIAFAARHEQRRMDAVEHAVAPPIPEVSVDGRTRSKLTAPVEAYRHSHYRAEKFVHPVI